MEVNLPRFKCSKHARPRVGGFLREVSEIDELGRGFGGEGPRAEGVGGGKLPPFQEVLTRPTEGRRMTGSAVKCGPFHSHCSQGRRCRRRVVPDSIGGAPRADFLGVQKVIIFGIDFCIDFGVDFGLPFGSKITYFSIIFCINFQAPIFM